MFVFGEVQDPNMETINLVEDIVRSQIIELVRHKEESGLDWVLILHRSFKPVHWPHGVGLAISQRKTLSFLFDTIEGK